MATDKKIKSDNSQPHFEAERKLVFPDSQISGRAARSQYREVFTDIAHRKEDFPDLSYIRGDRLFRRSITRKDSRSRIYLADENLAIVGAHFEIRHDLGTNMLMIKEGNGADNDHPTLNRTEECFTLIAPYIGSIKDIKTNNFKGKKAPKGLREIFNKANTKLYPLIQTQSLRDKLMYYRAHEFNGRLYIIALELARDQGTATPVLGNLYDLDQLEIEVKHITSYETGVDILDYPDYSVLTFEEIKAHIIEPVLDKEEVFLSENYGLVSMYESKPTNGFRQLKNEVGTDEYNSAIKVAREGYIQGRHWKEIYSPLVLAG